MKITGKNIERFIHRLYHHHIEILNLKYINDKTVIITIYASNYSDIIKLKTIYEIDQIGSSGIIKIKKQIKQNRFFFIGLSLALLFLYGLSNIMYDIEIVHTNKELRTLLYQELEEHGIKKGSIKKNFSELEKIKEQIINENRNKIEWLEIETVGTKYVVRVEMRKLEPSKENVENRNVVAKKSAIIKRVEATKGEIIKNTNDYVSAGDIIISGNLKLNEEQKETVPAEGKVYGEVWYKVVVSYPFAYQEEHLTGKKQTAYTFRFLNHTMQLFPFRYYKTKKVEETILFKHLFLPILFSKQQQQETSKVDEINTEDEAIAKAEKLARKKMESQLSDKEAIISEKKLKVEIKESRIELEIFFTVLEDITSYQNITEEKENK